MQQIYSFLKLLCYEQPFPSWRRVLTIVSFEEHETALNPEHCNFGDEGNIQCTPIVVAVCEGFKLSRMKQNKAGYTALSRS